MRQLFSPCEDAIFRCKSCCASSRNRSAFVVIFVGTLAPAMRNNRSATFMATLSDPSASISSHPCQDSIQDWSNTVLTSSSSCNTDKQIPATRSLMPGGGPPPQNRLRTLCPAAVRLHIQLCNFRRAAVRMSLLIPLVLLPTAISHASTVSAQCARSSTRRWCAYAGRCTGDSLTRSNSAHGGSNQCPCETLFGAAQLDDCLRSARTGTAAAAAAARTTTTRTTTTTTTTMTTTATATATGTATTTTTTPRRWATTTTTTKPTTRKTSPI